MTGTRAVAPQLIWFVLAAVVPTTLAATAALVSASAERTDDRTAQALQPVIEAERVRAASERLGRSPEANVAFREELARLHDDVRGVSDETTLSVVDANAQALLRADAAGRIDDAARENFGRSLDSFSLQARRAAERERILDTRAAARRQRGVTLLAVASVLLAGGLSMLLGRRMERAFRNARDAAAARERFLLDAVRELERPLGSVDRALAEVDSRMALESRSSVRSAKQALRQLHGMLAETGEAAGLSTGEIRLQRERVDLGILVRTVGARLTSGPAGLPVEVDVRGRATGDWDRARLEEVVTHLLANATKFGSGRRVKVVVYGGDPVRLVVRDHGAGIPRERQEHLFDGFGAPHERGGLGLGLYIARRIVEAHGGTIRVESEPGLGSTFTVELPPEPVQAAPQRLWSPFARPERA